MAVVDLDRQEATEVAAVVVHRLALAEAERRDRATMAPLVSMA